MGILTPMLAHSNTLVEAYQPWSTIPTSIVLLNKCNIYLLWQYNIHLECHSPLGV